MKYLIYSLMAIAVFAVSACGSDDEENTPPVENCTNQVDDDGDGFVDCEDFDCKEEEVCESVEDCSNGIDDDGDGFVDCEDFDCDC